MSQHPHLERLIATMATLRGPAGCEWDREQDHRSLVKFLIEETYELVDAIDTEDRAGMREELGDVLYQLLFHADIAASDDEDPFTIDDVARLLDEKMRRRHPHVFGDVEVSGVDEIRRNWQELKAREKADRHSVLDGVPDALPGIVRALQVLEKARRVDVIPPSTELDADMDELEFGRWLLSVLDGARHRGFDADRALRQATRELEDRVRQAEETGAS